jgi:adenosylcobinamide kinase/adenosylcobinamide-phosphate guanylyltransferase
MASGSADAAITNAAEALATLMADRAASMIAVSNEVGEGVHPSTGLGLRFRDLLGAVNQIVAAAADQVTWMVAGIPVIIKGAPAASHTDVSHERAPETP